VKGDGDITCIRPFCKILVNVDNR